MKLKSEILKDVVKFVGKPNLTNAADIVTYSKAHLGNLTPDQIGVLEKAILELNSHRSVMEFYQLHSQLSLIPAIEMFCVQAGYWSVDLEFIETFKDRFTPDDFQKIITGWVLNHGLNNASGDSSKFRKTLESYLGKFDINKLNESVRDTIMDDTVDVSNRWNKMYDWMGFRDLVDIDWVMSRVEKSIAANQEVTWGWIKTLMWKSSGSLRGKFFDLLIKRTNSRETSDLLELIRRADDGSITADEKVRGLRRIRELLGAKGLRTIYAEAKNHPVLWKEIVEEALTSDLIVTVAWFARHAEETERPKFVVRLRELIQKGELTVQMLAGEFSWSDVLDKQDYYEMYGGSGGMMGPMMFMLDGWHRGYK